MPGRIWSSGDPPATGTPVVFRGQAGQTAGDLSPTPWGASPRACTRMET
jgi:hypothetical protein